MNQIGNREAKASQMKRDYPTQLTGTIGAMLILVASLAASSALAQVVGDTVLDGLKLKYAGPNEITVTNGNDTAGTHYLTFGNPTNAAATTWSQGPTFNNVCWPPSTSLVANGFYYVYAGLLRFNSACPTASGAPILYVSTVPPNTDQNQQVGYWPMDNANCGIPPAGSSVSGQCAGYGFNYNGGGLVFVGSFLTDSNKNIIPFVRDGNNVWIYPSQTIGTAAGSGAGLSGTYWNPTGTVPVSFTVGWYVPRSASAVLLRFDMSNGGSSELDFAILDPLGLGVTGSSGSFTMNPQYVFRLHPTAPPQYQNVAVTVNGSSQMTMWADNIGFSLFASEMGYVEDVRSPAGR